MLFNKELLFTFPIGFAGNRASSLIIVVICCILLMLKINLPLSKSALLKTV